MKSRHQFVLFSLFTVLLISACADSDMIRPSQKIGPMWVNRYGHSNAQFIWDFCDDSMTASPGIQVTDCIVPDMDELFIGYGVRGVDKNQRDALWEARTWELTIDGHPVDLPAFNILDFQWEQEETLYEYRIWRVRLRKIPEGQHTLHYVMRVLQEIASDPDAKSPGVYELIVNFTYGE